MSSVLNGLSARIRDGNALSLALSQYPRLFSPLYIGLVRAGERSGELAFAFRHLVRHLERVEHLRSQFISAGIYPALLTAVGGLAVVVLFFVVLPQLAMVVEDNTATLTKATGALLLLSQVTKDNGAFLGTAFVMMLLTVAVYIKTDAALRFGTSIGITLPLLGQLLQDIFAARFARLVGTLHCGGAPLVSALETVAESVPNPLARDATIQIRMRVRDGTSLQEAVRQCDLFPPLLGQLIAVGDASGNLGEFLFKAAEIFEDRTERTLQRLVALAEPVIIVVVGGIVGFIALAMLQAIYSVNASAFQ